MQNWTSKGHFLIVGDLLLAQILHHQRLSFPLHIRAHEARQVQIGPPIKV